MQKSYESCSNKDPIEATDCDTSRLTTASFFKLRQGNYQTNSYDRILEILQAC